MKDYFIVHIWILAVLFSRSVIDCVKDTKKWSLDLKNNGDLAVHNVINVGRNSLTEIEAINIPPSTSYVLFQCHCQKYNVTIMYYDMWSYDSSVTGSSIGLVKYLEIGSTSTSVWLSNTDKHSFDCFLTAVPHYSLDPVPGGCNVEFNVPTSPFLHLYFTPVRTVLEYQSSNIGYNRSSVVQPSCDYSTYYVSYEFYVQFLPERNYESSAFVDGLVKSLTLDSLKQNAEQIKPYVVTPMKRLFFSSFPGQGVIYSIVAKYTSEDRNKTKTIHYAPYVPYVTYGCSFHDAVDGCYSINRTFTYVFCICAAIVGLVLCFCGHRFFKLEMFVAGFLAASLLSFILLIKYAAWSHSEREVATMSIGFVGGCLWLGIWWFFGIPIITILLVGFELGYLLSSILLFTPIGDLEFLRNNFNYWMTFSIGVIFVPVLLIYFTKTLSIVYCSVLGSYGVIVAIDRYIGTTLSYIVLNVVKRSIYGYMDAVNEVLPFQTNDMILCAVWLSLSMIGIVFQHHSEKGKPPFPPCPHTVWKRDRNNRQMRRQRSYDIVRTLRRFASNDNESAPLVGGEPTAPPATASYGSLH